MNSKIDNDIFIKSRLHYNTSSSQQKTSYPSFTQKEETDEYVKTNNSKVKTGITFGAIGAGLAGIFGWITNRGKKPPKPELEKPIVKATSEILSDLINKVKPENHDLASEVYPILLKTADSLNIKPENFENILTGIHKHNKDFMISEGIELISGKMEKLKDVIDSPVDDIPEIMKHLTHSNKNIFTTIADEPERFKVVMPDDITAYLDKLTPEKADYMFNELMPVLEKHEKELSIKLSDAYIKLLNTVRPEVIDVIPDVAKTSTGQWKGKKYQILSNLTAENKECAVPLLENIEKFNFNNNEINDVLKIIKNEDAACIKHVADNVESIRTAGLKPEEVLGILKSENDAKIFETVISDPKTYIIECLNDIKFYLKSVDVKNLDFLKNKLVPKLMEHKDDLWIVCSDLLADLMHYMKPETFDSIDMVLPYTKKYDSDTIYFINLLCGVSKDNMKNLPDFLEKLPAFKAQYEKKVGWWNGNMLPSEMSKILDNWNENITPQKVKALLDEKL